MRKRFVALAACAALATLSACQSTTICQAVDVDEAWRTYSAGEIDRAYQSFSTAVKKCPNYVDGQIGLGYSALRRGELPLAARMFDGVLKKQPETVDALLGRGMVHWRKAEFDQARTMFQRTIKLDPSNGQALEFLARFPAVNQAERPTLHLSDTVVYPARIAGQHFEVRNGGGWLPFYVKGVNIGAAIPGNHPTQFPDSITYATWLKMIGDMGANTIRVYTMHPPQFYRALLDYNRAHAAQPLWLLHGVWAELPPNETDYDDTAWKRAFYDDINTVINIIHGRADVPLRPGRTSGSYTADVSPWTLGFILGREWESHSVVGYNAKTKTTGEWSGKYVDVSKGTPIDVWLAQAVDHAVDYETSTYHAQRPVAYTNWPPTDPLRHVTESDIPEERRIRTSAGDKTRFVPLQGGNDAVTLDPTLIHPHPDFAAGYFASYHIYPYDPDFLVLDPELNKARSAYGASNYYGYLTALKKHHGNMAVLVSEYGLPASIGSAHFQPQGWHHGGNTEARVAEVDARLTHEIADAGMAGGIVFEWIDEWFKKTWNTEPFESPRERDRLWYNRMDAEEHYGMLAAEPLSPLGGERLQDRMNAWRAVRPLYVTADSVVMRASGDEAYLRVLVEFGARAPQELMIGFDVLDSLRGEFRWPDKVGARLPVGVEFVLKASSEYARLLVHQAYNPVKIDTLPFHLPGTPSTLPTISAQPPGFFRGRFMSQVRAPLKPVFADAGQYDSLRILPNRERIARDRTEYLAMGYDWGVLPVGPGPDGLVEWTDRAMEVRIPWQLLNVSDPSQRRVLSYERDSGELDGTRIAGIRMLLGLRNASVIRTIPAAGSPVANFTWPTWETPRWTARVRPTYWSVKSAWQSLQPAVLTRTTAQAGR